MGPFILVLSDQTHKCGPFLFNSFSSWNLPLYLFKCRKCFSGGWLLRESFNSYKPLSSINRKLQKNLHISGKKGRICATLDIYQISISPPPLPDSLTVLSQAPGSSCVSTPPNYICPLIIAQLIIEESTELLPSTSPPLLNAIAGQKKDSEYLP